jgi:hypothetical protein
LRSKEIEKILLWHQRNKFGSGSASVYELGLLDDFLKLPHEKVDHLTGQGMPDCNVGTNRVDGRSLLLECRILGRGPC